MSSFVERYQLLYEKDPRSKVFAPLAEAYRRMGLIDEAIDLAERGIQEHPNFASGRVALGKCYVQKGRFKEASEQLKVASELSPENLLAHQLLAECYARLKKPVEALNAYKIVLFLNPNDVRVAEIVKKLEAEIYAGQAFEEDGAESKEEYSMQPLREVSSNPAQARPEGHESSGARQENSLSQPSEQELALLDTRYERGDWGAVREQLASLLQKFPENSEVLSRKKYLDEITNNNSALAEWLTPVAPDHNAFKINTLRDLLSRIENRRKA